MIPSLAESLLKLHSAPHAVSELDALIQAATVDAAKAARLKYAMGLEMEKRDQRDVAHDLYRAASELNPADADVSKRLASVAATFASGSKYDYLLREKMVTTDQLQKAFGLSKKT
nr:hypothetical protein [Desulfobacterales bacterium]